jgi:hypothetical protein
MGWSACSGPTKTRYIVFERIREALKRRGEDEDVVADSPADTPPGRRQSCEAVKVGRPSGLASGFQSETNACLLFVAGVSSLMEAL